MLESWENLRCPEVEVPRGLIDCIYIYYVSMPILRYEEGLSARLGWTYRTLRANIAAALFVIQTILEKKNGQECRIFRKLPESERRTPQRFTSGRIGLLTKYI